MARRARRNRQAGRVLSNNANRTRRLPRTTPVRRVSVTLTPLSPLRLVEDRRFFHPAPHVRPAAAFIRSAARVVVRGPRQTRAPFSFASPSRVLVCVRRQVRKEVLHAFSVAGSSGLRKPRKGPFSNVKC